MVSNYDLADSLRDLMQGKHWIVRMRLCSLADALWWMEPGDFVASDLWDPASEAFRRKSHWEIAGTS